PYPFQHYASAISADGAAAVPSVFGEDWIVLRQVDGPRLSSTLAVEVAEAVRGALLAHADDPPPEMLSGHQENGQPSEIPQVAAVPLPFVGAPHATGVILGVAVVMPRYIEPGERRAVVRAVGKWEQQ